jgi:formylglycine-generating enzyme required for sulfatase activity
MGNSRSDGYPGDGEGPVHEVSLPAFDLATTSITNVQFSDFVTDSGYVTDADDSAGRSSSPGFYPTGFRRRLLLRRLLGGGRSWGVVAASRRSAVEFGWPGRHASGACIVE